MNTSIPPGYPQRGTPEFLKHAAETMAGAAIGRQVEGWWATGNWWTFGTTTPTWDWNTNYYRLAPDPAVDWTKPIQTSDGKPARLVCDDVKHAGGATCLVVVTTDDANEVAYHVRPDGTLSGGSQFIVNVPQPEPKQYTGWVNWYARNGRLLTGDTHPNRKTADHSAGLDRIACTRVVVKEGQFDE